MNISLLSSRWGRRVGKDFAKPPRIPKPTFETNRWNIVKGDLVQVTQGPQTGQRGKVLDVLRKANRIVIEGVNMVRKIWRKKFFFCEVLFVLIYFSLEFTEKS